MNRKALLVATCFAVLSMLVLPVLAQPTDFYLPVTARGCACVKTCHGFVSGCATLRLFLPPVGSDPPGDYVQLEVRGQSFRWIIDLASVKFGKNIMTLCAYPVCPWSAPGPITVVVWEKAPYCASAFGCGVSFIGKAIAVIDG